MLFDSKLFKRKSKCFRQRWSESHYLTYDKDRELFMEHNGRCVHPWYWETSDEFKNACEDLTADDWGYI